jgi:hypothetical protein
MSPLRKAFVKDIAGAIIGCIALGLIIGGLIFFTIGLGVH